MGLAFYLCIDDTLLVPSSRRDHNQHYLLDASCTEMVPACHVFLTMPINHREARHPFLDEAVLDAILSLPLPLIADLTLPPGSGDKLVLRTVLGLLGLPRAGARVKRAIQFGTRLGKLANQRDWGSNRAANLASAGSVRLGEVPHRHAQSPAT